MVRFELTLPAAVSSVGIGRRLVRDALLEWGLAELTDTAALLTSEVLTNSVLHARTPIVLVVVREADDLVTVTVHDGSRHLPQRRRHARDATTGRGLELLDKLALRWHVEPDDGGKTLTFSVGGGIDPWAAYSKERWGEVADL